MISDSTASISQQTICVQTAKAQLEATLCIPELARGVVLFAHHAGGGRENPPNRAVAERLWQEGFATLQMDLLTGEEERLDVLGKLSYDIPLLAGRIDSAADWIGRHFEPAGLPIGYFGAGTGAAAALVASLQKSDTVGAIVSLGGRMDLAESVLAEIKPPILFLVESEPPVKLAENRRMARRTLTEKKIISVRGAECFFEEPEDLTEIAEYAVNWFRQHLTDTTYGWKSSALGAHIDSCSFGRIRVDGKDYTKDLIVFSERQVVHWWRREHHRVHFTDLKDVIFHRPELIIVGTGTLGNLKLEPSVHRMLRKYNISCLVEKTDQATVLFNKHVAKGVKAAGVFHLTC